MYECPKCKNKDVIYFATLNNKIYCRKCINFNGKMSFNDIVSDNQTLTLDFSLTDKQKEISKKITSAINNKKNVFLYAVTGAGKTELVYEAMLNVLKNKGKVGFTVPRKDVVIDLYPRIKNAFKNSKVVALYGGNTSNLTGDIIILTTHQLYRFENYFDLLVFDEIDAFPYKGNDVLISFFSKSVKGNYVLMSATPDEEKVNEVISSNGIYLSLTRRYHGVDLPLPKIELTMFSMIPLLINHLKRFIKENKRAFVFVPTIEEGEKLFRIIKLFFKNCEYVYSYKKERNVIISDFKNGKYDFLITTSILERGVTVSSLQVIVYRADHEIFDSASLIQISGRVGRKINSPYGEVIFLANKNTSEMELAINKIKEANNG